MRTFEARIVRVDWKEKGVFLEFEGNTRETIYIKDIKFYMGNEIYAEERLFSVILGNGIVTRFFEFPDQNVDYNKMTFLIKQEDENGWEVSIDLLNGSVLAIEKSRCKVL